MTVQSEIYIPDGQGAILTCPRLATAISERWFDPLFWGDCAEPVAAGGRGGAWFIESCHGPMVLREYRRGGLVASLSEKTYVFTGESSVRSFAEFRLMTRLKTAGLPVPSPIAAYYRRTSSLTFQARILVERLTGVWSLAEYPDVADTKLWFHIGQVIRRFHDCGLDHVDLNCHNILISPTEVYLIDFDRCKLYSQEQDRGDWRSGNLQRLNRSCEKLFDFWSHSGAGLWNNLRAGYDGLTDG